MGKIIKLTESDLVKIIERVISEQSTSGRQQINYSNIPNFHNEMKKIKGLKWNDMGKFYSGVVNGVTYKFKENGPNGQGTYHTVSVNSNTTGEYVFDKSSTQPFTGIKIVTSRKEQPKRK